MEALSNLTSSPQPQRRFSLHRSLNSLRRRPHHQQCPPISKSVTSISTSLFSIKASVSHSHSSSSSILKLPLCVAAVSAALFVSRLSPFRPLPALAEAPAVATISENTPNDAVPEKAKNRYEEEVEKDLQEKLAANPNDIESLKSLLELKMRRPNLPEVIEIASKLIDLEPEEVEWRLLVGHSYCSMGEHDLAKPLFEEVLSKDQNKVEAYHGLVMAAAPLDVDNGNELRDLEKRIQETIERLGKENKKAELRDFHLLIAQIRVIQGEYLAALNVYQDLVKQEPRDYRPYLCQGIIYTLLRKKKEAEEQFEKYRRLVPKEHPYADYFDHNVKNTFKVFSEK